MSASHKSQQHGSTAPDSANSPASAAAGLSPVERLEWLRLAGRDKRLKPTTFQVLVELACYCNVDAGIAWPSQQTLADDLGIDQPRVSKAIKQAVACGYIAVETRTSWVQGKPIWMNQYRLLHPPKTPLVLVPELPPRATQPPPDMSAETYPTPPDMSAETYRPGPDMSFGGGADMSVQTYRTRKGTRKLTKSPSETTTTQPPSKKEPSPKPQAQPIEADWWPSAESWADAIAKYGFAQSELEEITKKFRAYWILKGTPRPGWGASWWAWLKRDMAPQASHSRPSNKLMPKTPGEIKWGKSTDIDELRKATRKS